MIILKVFINYDDPNFHQHKNKKKKFLKLIQLYIHLGNINFQFFNFKSIYHANLRTVESTLIKIKNIVKGNVKYNNAL